MSELETDAKPTLAPIIAGGVNALDPASQPVVALWAIKTAMTFEYTYPAPYRYQIASEDYAWIFKTKSPTARTSVGLALAEAPDQPGHLDWNIVVAAFRQRLPGPGSPYLNVHVVQPYTACIRIGGLVLVIIRHPSDGQIVTHHRADVMRQVTEIWPTGHGVVRPGDNRRLTSVEVDLLCGPIFSPRPLPVALRS